MTTASAMNADKPLISCRNLTKVYRMGDQEVHALAGVAPDVGAGGDGQLGTTVAVDQGQGRGNGDRE